MSTLTSSYSILAQTLLVDAGDHGCVTVEVAADFDSTVGDLLDSAGLDCVELRTWSDDFPSFSYPTDPSGLLNSPVDANRRAFYVSLVEDEDGDVQVNLLDGSQNANGLVAVPRTDDETADLTDAMDAVEIWESHTYGEVTTVTVREEDGTIIGQMSGITEQVSEAMIMETVHALLNV